MMIGTVFFLAIAAPILAAVYPTTTSYDRETKYQPRTPRGPSNARTTYEPTPAPAKYNPTDDNPGQAPGNYNPGQAPGNYNPGQAPGNYNPGQAPGNYNPGQAPGNYNPTSQESRYGEQPSNYNAQDDPYTNYFAPSTRNIRREIADASAEVASASRTNRVYQTNLDIIAQKINQSSSFRQRFEGYLYQQLVASIAAQDKKIENYRSQVDGLSDLTRDLRDLTDKVNALTSDVVNIRKRQTNIRATVDQLSSGYGAETLSIVTVEDQTDGNDEILELIREADKSNRARYNANLKDLDVVVQTVNDERAEVYTVVLSASNSSVYVKFDTPFSKQPQVAWGIIGLELNDINEGRNDRQQSTNSYRSQQETNSYRSQQETDSYGSQKKNNSYDSKQSPNNYGSKQSTNSYDSKQSTNSYGGQQSTNSYSGQQERIFPRVVARADTKGLTVTLVDRSVGWRTDSIRVRVLVAYVNNDKISTGSSGRTY